MTYKAYIDNIKQKTGKGPEDFRAAARKLGLSEHAELLKWLKSDCELGHGYANALILYIRHTADAKKKLAADAAMQRRKRTKRRS
jgi:hypothetical protein